MLSLFYPKITSRLLLCLNEICVRFKFKVLVYSALSCRPLCNFLISTLFISINELVVTCVAWRLLSSLNALRKLRSRANELQSRANERPSQEEPRLDYQLLFGKEACAPPPKVLLGEGRPDRKSDENPA